MKCDDPRPESTRHSDQDLKSQSIKNQGIEESRAPLSPPLTARTTDTEGNQRHAKSDLPSDDEHSKKFGPHKAPKVSRIEDIKEIVRKRIEEANQQH